ncbi:WAP, Kazal, immunoglobulin, Kunitz and NTR domain-containing protein 2-like [Clavelina lepadiformis]|uniref:Uncharacterized protein n=1 Tax=Clavelina lepadiformis TaxID=159417 RepID=A0ABP0FF40_CLALP
MSIICKYLLCHVLIAMMMMIHTLGGVLSSPASSSNLPRTNVVEIDIPGVDIPTCNEIRCTGQGYVCRDNDGVASCICIPDCPLPTVRGEFICASDNQTYFNRCTMNKMACEKEIELHEVECNIVHHADTSSGNQQPYAQSITFQLTVQVGMQARLPCEVGGDPRPTILWKREGTDDDHMSAGFARGRKSVTADGTLVISSALAMDAGTYICLAFNRLGSVKLPFTLVVRGHHHIRSGFVNKELTYDQKCVENITFQAKNCRKRWNHRRALGYWIHNPSSGRCEENYFRDCETIYNKYTTKKECEETCTDECQMPPATGGCNDFSARIFYNKTSMECEAFPYSGCGGNGNNFLSTQACRQRCKTPRISSAPTKPACPFCSQHMTKKYCRSDFVIQARVLRIFTNVVDDTQMMKVRITYVFKDDLLNLGLSLYDLSDPSDSELTLEVHLDSQCPCPDITNHLPRPSDTSFSGTRSNSYHCSLDYRRHPGSRSLHLDDSHCVELIISGVIRNGYASIVQGSLVVPASDTNIARMTSNTVCSGICSIFQKNGPTIGPICAH